MHGGGGAGEHTLGRRGVPGRVRSAILGRCGSVRDPPGARVRWSMGRQGEGGRREECAEAQSAQSAPSAPAGVVGELACEKPSRTLRQQRARASVCALLPRSNLIFSALAGPAEVPASWCGRRW